MAAEPKSVAIIGAGIFGLSTANALRDRGHKVTVFDKCNYDQNAYDPADKDVQAASVDYNKIFRASYGSKLHYQQLAMESRAAWVEADLLRSPPSAETALFVNSGMLRVQSSSHLDTLEQETLANMTRDGLRDLQFIKSDAADRQRAQDKGWEAKLLDFEIEPGSGTGTGTSFEAVLDSTAGFVRCSNACAYYQGLAAAKGVEFRFGREGEFDEFVAVESGEGGKKRVIGLKTKDGREHRADVVVVAAGSFTTQILPDLTTHLESSAGSVATFRIDESNTSLWNKYAPETFPVITWKAAPRDNLGKDSGSVYILPRTPEGLVKIGFRGIKFTNFQPAPPGTPFTQSGQWSIPLSARESQELPERSVDAIRRFVGIFLPEFKDVPFHSTKLCWYTDSMDNSFVIDHVPSFAANSVFVCTGGSGHGAKFLPVLGKHAADILENGEKSSSFMRPFWRWRPEVPRGNGLEEGPGGVRNIGGR